MKKFLIGASIFVGIILVLISPFACMAYKLKQATVTQTDPQKFEAILAKRNEGGYKPHFFPKQIEENAEQVGFYYTPGFLQGGTTMVLRMKFPEGELLPLTGDFNTEKPLKPSDFTDAGFRDELRRLPPYAQQWEYNLDELESLNGDFTIYLQSSNDLEQVKENWNHNEISYIAISYADREIVYYYSQW